MVSGDTLSAIGEKFGVAWQDIQYFNNIQNPNLIYVGQVMYIPFTTDPIATNAGYGSNENTYDYQIVEFAVNNVINPMLEKAQTQL
jgi:LysM repeat protein